jgi:hypothetical protein
VNNWAIHRIAVFTVSDSPDFNSCDRDFVMNCDKHFYEGYQHRQAKMHPARSFKSPSPIEVKIFHHTSSMFALPKSNGADTFVFEYCVHETIADVCVSQEPGDCQC